MKYPKVGEQVRIKNETRLHTVKAIHPSLKSSIRGIRFTASIELDSSIVPATNLITRHQKTIKTWIVQGDYGSGWEDVTAEETYGDGRRALRDYRDNDPTHAHRLIVRYEPNDLYQGGAS